MMSCYADSNTICGGGKLTESAEDRHENTQTMSVCRCMCVCTHVCGRCMVFEFGSIAFLLPVDRVQGRSENTIRHISMILIFFHGASAEEKQLSCFCALRTKVHDRERYPLLSAHGLCIRQSWRR